MGYKLIKDIIDLVEDYEADTHLNKGAECSVEGFKRWIANSFQQEKNEEEPNWEGKSLGRSPESIIASNVVHMNRFGKTYFKSAFLGTDISSQDDVIYLIVLKFSKNLTKMDLIRKNVHDKPAGMQIINRLIKKGWVEQSVSDEDKRSKIIQITPSGLKLLEDLFDKVRVATDIVSGNLTPPEKMELIRLLNKLNDFHQRIYERNIESENLLDIAYTYIND